jgi:hypothetical protein
VAATINQLFRHPETARRAAQALQERGVAPEEISVAGGDGVGLLSGSLVSRPLPDPSHRRAAAVPPPRSGEGRARATRGSTSAALQTPVTTVVLSVATERLSESEVRRLLEEAAAAEGPMVRPNRRFDPNEPPAPDEVTDEELVSDDVPAARVNMQVPDRGLGS